MPSKSASSSPSSFYPCPLPIMQPQPTQRHPNIFCIPSWSPFLLSANVIGGSRNGSPPPCHPYLHLSDAVSAMGSHHIRHHPRRENRICPTRVNRSLADSQFAPSSSGKGVKGRKEEGQSFWLTLAICYRRRTPLLARRRFDFESTATSCVVNSEERKFSRAVYLTPPSDKTRRGLFGYSSQRTELLIGRRIRL